MAGIGLIHVLLVFGLPFALFCYLKWKWNRRRLYNLAERIPDLKESSSASILDKPDLILKELINASEDGEDVLKMWMGHRLFVCLSHPDDIETVLRSFDNIEKTPEQNAWMHWLGRVYVSITGEIWKEQRSIIAPPFHIDVVKSFVPIFNSNSRLTVSQLKSHVGKEIDAYDVLSQGIAESLLQTMMGLSTDLDDRGAEYVHAIMKMCEILYHRMRKLWLRPDWIYSLTDDGRTHSKLVTVINRISEEVVDKRRAELNLNSPALYVKTNKKKEGGPYTGQNISTGLVTDAPSRTPLLDQMLEKSENGVVLTYEDIQHQMNTIMFEGIDKTAIASSFFLCLMSAHPEVQKKCIEEIDDIFGDDRIRDIAFEDTLKMKYLERCLMETLRLYPPVSVIGRQLTEELRLKSKNLKIPASSTVLLATYKLHRRNDLYKNANNFNPDNFLPENSAGRHHFSFVPFSSGPYNCIGRKYAMLHLKVLIATVLRNFKVAPGIPEEDWELQANITLKRVDGFRLVFEPRT